jgi:hypothetical protein
MQFPPENQPDQAPEKEVETPRNHHLPIGDVISPCLHPDIFLERKKHPKHYPGGQEHHRVQEKRPLWLYLFF